MVYQPAQPSEIKKHKRSRAVQLLLDVFTLVLVAGATYAIFKLTTVKPENQEANNPEVVNKVPVEEEAEENKAWLARTVGGWLETFSRDFRVGVEVYDLDNDAAVGEAYADETFDRQVATELGAKFGVGQAGAGATSAREMTEVLKAAFKHAGMSDEDWQSYKATWLAQPEVFSEDRCQGYCKVRAGLPAGFSDKAKVYNENYMDSNGSFFEAYRDLAIVELAGKNGETRSFAVAVLGYGFSTQTDFAKLGEMLEKTMTLHLQNEGDE